MNLLLSLKMDFLQMDKIITNIQSIRVFFRDFVLLFIRLWIAKIFIVSGFLKLESWDSTISLFETEYMLPILHPNIAFSKN